MLEYQRRQSNLLEFDSRRRHHFYLQIQQLSSLDPSDVSLIPRTVTADNRTFNGAANLESERAREREEGLRQRQRDKDRDGRDEDRQGGREGEITKESTAYILERGGGGGGGGGGVYLESYTREARFLTRWDQHAVAQRRP